MTSSRLLIFTNRKTLPKFFSASRRSAGERILCSQAGSQTQSVRKAKVVYRAHSIREGLVQGVVDLDDLEAQAIQAMLAQHLRILRHNLKVDEAVPPGAKQVHTPLVMADRVRLPEASVAGAKSRMKAQRPLRGTYISMATWEGQVKVIKALRLVGEDK